MRLFPNITLNNTPIPIVQPTDPFKYLGVHFTLTRDWTHQKANIAEQIKTKTAQLLASDASMNQKLVIETQSILGAMRHSFCVAPFNPTTLYYLDSLRAKLLKRINGMPNQVNQNFLYLLGSDFGLEHPSVLRDYIRVSTTSLLESLNDTGRLGTLTRALHNQEQALHTQHVRSTTYTDPHPRFKNISMNMNKLFYITHFTSLTTDISTL